MASPFLFTKGRNKHMKKDMYDNPQKSIEKYFKSKYSKSNDFDETRKVKKDKKVRYAMAHPKKRKRVINKCIKCKHNKDGYCLYFGKWCSDINDYCYDNKIIK